MEAGGERRDDRVMGRIHDTFQPNIAYVSSAMKQTYFQTKLELLS